MHWSQQIITLAPRPRGFHLVTREIVEQATSILGLRVGFAHLFIQHTSASLTLNENASGDVLRDFESHMNVMVPEVARYWTHTVEGPDDMPAHIKASLFGSGLLLPIQSGRLALGTWQGIYLGEHRDRGGRRRIVVTVLGEEGRP